MTPNAAPLHPVSDTQLRRITAVLGLGAIASILDSTVINVGLDHLATVFNATLPHTQWIITAFLLAMTAVVPLTGWLMDRLGAKTTWLIALSAFLAGSIACGSAWNLTSLITFRALQGLGAGLILPSLMTLLTLNAGKERLMNAMASFSLIAQIGPVLGPLLGGLILHTASWRWLFLVNIPFCLIGLYLAWRIVPATAPSPSPRSFDAIGLCLLAPALTLAVYGLDQTSTGTDLTGTRVWVPLVLAIVLAGGFIAWSLRQGRSSILDVRLFSDRAFRTGSLLSIMAGFTMFGGLLLLPLYFIQIRHASILNAAVWLIPQGLGAASLILYGKPLTSRLSTRSRITLGFALIALGTIPFALPDMRQHDSLLILGLLVRGLGIGASNPAVNASALTGLDETDISAGTTAFNVVQRVGAPLGTTVIAVALARLETHHTPMQAFTIAFWITTACAALPALIAQCLPCDHKTP